MKKENTMKKKITMLLAAAIVIGCMSLPAMAGTLNIDDWDIQVAYHNTHMEHQGHVYLRNSGHVKYRVSLADRNWTKRGGIDYEYYNNGSHDSVSGWIDASYNSIYVHVKKY